METIWWPELRDGEVFVFNIEPELLALIETDKFFAYKVSLVKEVLELYNFR